MVQFVSASSDGPRKAAQCLRDGGLVAFPTETFYGLAALADHEGAVARLFELKERDGRPIPLIAADSDHARRWVRLSGPLEALAKAHWPGPLTIAAPAAKACHPALLGGGPTLGIRVPGHGLARELAALAGGVITSTSANLRGGAPAVSAADIDPSMHTALDMILDGGPCPGGMPSTVVGEGDGRVTVLRPGVLEPGLLAETLGYAP